MKKLMDIYEANKQVESIKNELQENLLNSIKKRILEGELTEEKVNYLLELLQTRCIEIERY